MTQARPGSRAESGVTNRPRFSFAVVADTHLNPVDDVSTSPWQTNAAANARSRAIVAELNAAGVEFVVHLGDMIHPIPSHPDYSTAAARFQAIFGELEPPLYVVPGNHDVGDKPIAWTPAPTIDDDFLARYRDHFGADHYTFDHDDATFVVVDAQLLNAPLAAATDHDRWVAATLADARARDRRIFVLLHYPLYLHDPAEASHYDNLDEPGRGRLLELVVEHRVEAVFAGHVHNFFFDHHRGVDLYVAPSTAFVRHDYAELFRIAPFDDEHGRGDADKLGYLIVDVHDTGHVVRHRRTGALRLDEGHDLALEPIVRTHPATTRVNPGMVLDLRHRWAEEAEIPHTGGVDEMGRKLVRNDYVLQAIWELGLWRLRVPASDLTTPVARKRMHDLARQGLRFTVFCWHAEADRLAVALADTSEIVEAVEIIAPLDEPTLARLAPTVARIRKANAVVALSPLQAHRHDQATTVHAIRHGLPVDVSATGATGAPTAADASPPAASRHRDGGPMDQVSAVFDGVVLRAGAGDDVWAAVAGAAERAAAWDLTVTVHVQAPVDDPATPQTADQVLERAVTAMAAAAAFPAVKVVFDTFQDHDRGYFPRPGLFDRRLNPRAGARAVATLGGVLAGFAGHEPTIVLPRGGATGSPALVLSAGHAHAATLTREPDVDRRRDAAGPGTFVDLTTGAVASLPGTVAFDVAGSTVAVSGDGDVTAPWREQPAVILPRLPLDTWLDEGLVERRWIPTGRTDDEDRP